MKPDHLTLQRARMSRRPAPASRWLARLGGPLAGVCLALAASGTVLGQALPPELFAATSISGDQKQRIEAFAQAQLTKLKGDDKAAREAARDELIKPLDAQGVALAFRLAYGTALASELGRLASNPDDHVAFNALRVAGRLGTPAGIDVMREALADKRASVRAGAARSMREAIRSAVTAAQSPVNKSKLEGAVDALASALKTEADPIVARALIQALDAARAGTVEAFGDLHARAMEKLGESLAARLKTAPATGDEAGAWSEAAVAGVDSVRRTFLDPQRSKFAGAAGLKKQAATACGQALSWVRARLAAGAKSGAADDAALRSLTNAAETTLILIDGGSIKQLLAEALAASLEGGTAQAFNAASDEWMARLKAAPFSLDPKMFTR